MAKATIADTLIEIAEDSRLRKGEKVSLKLIAAEVRKLLRENKKLRKLLGEVKEEPLAAMKIRNTLEVGDN